MRATLSQSIRIILAIAVLAGCAEPAEPVRVAEPVRAIKYLVMGEGAPAQTRRLSGHIRARESSQLSFQVPGQVLVVHVDVGATVEHGAVIAELDPRPYELRVATAEAELSSARSALREREENYRKQQRVFKQQYISRSELDRAQSEFEKADSAVKLAGSRLELAQRDLKNTRLLAPFRGVINRRDVEPFEDVVSARPVFEIQGDAGFEVALLLPSRLLSAIQRGSAATVAIPALGIGYMPGQVTELGLRADSRGAYPLTVSFDSAGSSVQAGMAAEVTLSLAQGSSGLFLPGAALLVDGAGGRFVFRYDPGTSTVQKVPVQTTHHDLETLEVEEGLSAGDIICIAGVEFLRDGQRVTLYEPPG